MARFLLRKITVAVPTILGCITVVFIAMRVIPGDPVIMMLGEDPSPDAILRLRDELRLDDPISEQYLRFVGDMATGNLGESLRRNQSVVESIGDVFPLTIELAITSFVFAAFAGIVAGIISAVRQYSLTDNVLSVAVVVGISTPNFWAAILAILLFGLYLDWLPIAGALALGHSIPRVTGMYVLDGLIAGDWAAAADAFSHLIMPAIVLGLGPMALITRQVRSSMLEVLRQDYVTTARSKGLKERSVIVRHVLRNSMIPVTTIMGLQLGHLLSGTLIVETIFARPGIGSLAVNSILFRDFPVVQGVVMLTVVVVIVLNIGVDVLYAYLDPRITYA